jgi:hypothetical protein
MLTKEATGWQLYLLAVVGRVCKTQTTFMVRFCVPVSLRVSVSQAMVSRARPSCHSSWDTLTSLDLISQARGRSCNRCLLIRLWTPLAVTFSTTAQVLYARLAKSCRRGGCQSPETKDFCSSQASVGSGACLHCCYTVQKS